MVRPILIVDDEIDHAIILRAVIASVAPERTTDTCTDPSRLPGVLLEAEPDAVVFIDRMLKGVESFGYLAEASRAREDLHVVVLSSALSEEDERRARSAGATTAIEKPGTLAEWRALVTGILDQADRARGDGQSGDGRASRAG